MQAIDSCLWQTASSIEIVVCDDCSSEDLRSTVESFRDPRIRYHRNDIRLGATKNHQQAVSWARGIYVLVLNSDDLVLPECLEMAVSGLRKWHNAAAAYFATTYLTGSTIQGFHELPRVDFANNETYLENPWLEKYHGTSPSCCLFRKAAFDGIGGYRLTLRFAYDWDLYMRFMRQGGGVAFVPEVLTVYRKHPEQMVNDRSIDGLLDVLDLWRLPEYSHWSSTTIAGLVLTHCRDTVRKGHSLLPLLHSLREYERKYRLWSGIPGALLAKVGLVGGDETDIVGENYRIPNGVELAIQRAKAMLKDKMNSGQALSGSKG
jgi:glycosyltransferase involved in cell wall biosynthesis